MKTAPDNVSPTKRPPRALTAVPAPTSSPSPAPASGRVPRIGDRVLVGVDDKSHAPGLVTSLDAISVAVVVFRTDAPSRHVRLLKSAQLVLDLDSTVPVPLNRWAFQPE